MRLVTKTVNCGTDLWLNGSRWPVTIEHSRVSFGERDASWNYLIPVRNMSDEVFGALFHVDGVISACVQ